MLQGSENFTSAPSCSNQLTTNLNTCQSNPNIPCQCAVDDYIPRQDSEFAAWSMTEGTISYTLWPHRNLTLLYARVFWDYFQCNDVTLQIRLLDNATLGDACYSGPATILVRIFLKFLSSYCILYNNMRNIYAILR